MPDIEKYYDPNYLSKYDFEEKEVKTLTIRDIKSEDIFNPGKREKSRKPVIFFKEREPRKDEHSRFILDDNGKQIIKEVKPFIVNKTNSKAISKLYGKDTDGWLGKQIAIYVDKNVSVGRETVGGLRVKEFLPKAAPKLTCEECQAEIRGTKSIPDPEDVAEWGVKNFGKKLCVTCATKMAAAKEEENNGV